MRKSFGFFIILLSFNREVLAKMEFNPQNFENNDFMVEGENQRRFLEDDPYQEGSTKWNIDLSDMLNFDSSGNNFALANRPLTREEFKRLLRADRTKNRGGDFDENADSDDEEDIDALLEQDEELKMQVQEYLIRYVNLFLNLLELKDKRTEDGDEEVVDFDFVITARDLRALQDLAENFEERSVFDQLYVIDSIISRGIRVKQKYSFYQDFVNSFSKSSEFSRELFISKSSYFYIFVGIGVTMILAKSLIGLSFKFIAFVFVNNMILMEGLFNYFRKIKEANIADYVDRMKYATEYEACNTEGQSIFGKLYDMFYENQCLTYHRNLQLNRADSIFPLESIINAYSFYFVEVPCKILGTGINAFVVSVNAYLPLVARQLGEATTQFCIVGFLLVALILYLITPQFTITLMGAQFRVNFGQPEELRNRNPRKSRRVRGITRASLNEVDSENNSEDDSVDPPEEDLDSLTDDNDDTRMDIEELDSSIEDEIEILEEHVMTDDDDSYGTDEKSFYEDGEAIEDLPYYDN